MLVLCKANGWVHTSIPLAAKMVEYLGDKTGAWMTTISYDPAEITAENLKGYDAIFLDSTTGQFLDDPNDKTLTRRPGKRCSILSMEAKDWLGSTRPRIPITPVHVRVAGWPGSCPTGTWPEFNQMIGGFFKFHWTYPTLIPVKIDDPNSPLTAMFPGPWLRNCGRDLYLRPGIISRKRVHVLTSINYAKMSAEDKAKEPAEYETHRRGLRIELHSAGRPGPCLL